MVDVAILNATFDLFKKLLDASDLRDSRKKQLLSDVIDPLYKELTKVILDYYSMMFEMQRTLAQTNPDLQKIYERLLERRAGLVMARNAVLGGASAVQKLNSGELHEGMPEDAFSKRLSKFAESIQDLFYVAALVCPVREGDEAQRYVDLSIPTSIGDKEPQFITLWVPHSDGEEAIRLRALEGAAKTPHVRRLYAHFHSRTGATEFLLFLQRLIEAQGKTTPEYQARHIDRFRSDAKLITSLLEKRWRDINDAYTELRLQSQGALRRRKQSLIWQKSVGKLRVHIVWVISTLAKGARLLPSRKRAK